VPRKKTSLPSVARKPKKPAEHPAAKWNTIPGYDAIATAGNCTFDEQAALHVIRFIETACKLTTSTWAGMPFVLLPWQKAVIANAYGWMRPDGTRRYRRVHILIPRKCGKTELGAALALYHLLADDEPTPEVISIAADRAQAGRCLEAAKRMVRAEPMLESRTEVYQHRVIVPSTAGVYKVMSSEAPSAHGLNTSACIADEVHAMENRRELWEAIETSVGARRQPMLVTITTAGTLRESLEFEMFDYALKVRDRVIDNPFFLPVVYSAGDGDDWTSPETWRKCAPSLGHTVHEGYYAEKCKEAQEQPSMETPFRTYYLCQHVSASNRWLRMADWDKCKLDFDESRLAGLPCYLGIDLGETSDLTALTAVWLDKDEAWVRSWAFAPEEGAQRRQKRDKVPYLDWSRQGHMRLTPGDATDYEFVRREILRIVGEHKVQAVGYDPYNASGLAQQLEADGLRLKRVPQSYYYMAEPTKRWEAMVTNHRLRHDGNPVLTWAMSNCVVELDANSNPRPSKRRSTEKIDPVVAGIVALAVALDAAPTVSQATPYAERGILWL
jgi:phage terminase large subunit-like protein